MILGNKTYKTMIRVWLQKEKFIHDKNHIILVLLVDFSMSSTSVVINKIKDAIIKLLRIAHLLLKVDNKFKRKDMEEDH